MGSNSKKTHVKKGDIVQVIAGREKGKTGKVLQVFKDENRVIVEKVNMMKRHTKPSQGNQQGGILEREGKIHISNVMPWTRRPTNPRGFAESGSKTARMCA